MDGYFYVCFLILCITIKSTIMEIRAKINKIGELENFTTTSGKELRKVEIVLSAGHDCLVAAAFDAVADSIIASHMGVGKEVVAGLRFSVSGNDRKFNNVRITDIAEY